MRSLIVLLTITSALTGCASTLPTCDGKDRRPINVPARADVSYTSCDNRA